MGVCAYCRKTSICSLWPWGLGWIVYICGVLIRATCYNDEEIIHVKGENCPLRGFFGKILIIANICYRIRRDSTATVVLACMSSCDM